MKGPASAQSKNLFYVYGQGFHARDGLKVKPSETVGVGQDYAWSSTKVPNSLYYSLEYKGNFSHFTFDEPQPNELINCVYLCVLASYTIFVIYLQV